jgi:hypothetical protein
MNKLLMTAVGLGVTYLWKNKDARQKLINKIQTFTSKTKPQI